MNEFNDIKKILVTRTDKLGDVILTLPLISELERNFPSAKINFLVSNYVKDLIENYNGIDEIVCLEDYKSFSSKLNYLRNANYDAVINVFPRFGLAFAFYAAGIKYRIGSGYRWYSFLYNKKVYEHRKYAEKHESDYNLNLLKPLIQNINYDKKFYFKYSEAEQNKLGWKLTGLGLEIKDKFIILHPSSKSSSMDLPGEKFKILCSDLLQKFKDIEIVLTGEEGDNNINNFLLEGLASEEKKRVFNFAGVLNLKELMILIDKSKLFISNSTGPIHIAGALNKNIIGFYPDKIPMNAERWKPLSSNTIIIKPEKPDDMNSIKVGTITGAVKGFLYGKN